MKSFEPHIENLEIEWWIFAHETFVIFVHVRHSHFVESAFYSNFLRVLWKVFKIAFQSINDVIIVGVASDYNVSHTNFQVWEEVDAWRTRSDEQDGFGTGWNPQSRIVAITTIVVWAGALSWLDATPLDRVADLFRVILSYTRFSRSIPCSLVMVQTSRSYSRSANCLRNPRNLKS